MTGQESTNTLEADYDVAIIGGGPAGLQAALILARTRRRIIVFDALEPPRNAASHGVHNFIGLDGLTPAQIRAQAWAQIAVYDSAILYRERVMDVQSAADGFLVTGEAGTSVTARHVILAHGYRDVLPDIPGFSACWGRSIFACPYCDGYENRDGTWGMVVTSVPALEHMPQIFRNWTASAVAIVSPDIAVSDEQRAALAAQGIVAHSGNIAVIHHAGSKVEAVTLDTGVRIDVDALWWRPAETPQPLTQEIIDRFSLALDANGGIKTDANHKTDVAGLWAVGDLRGWASALGAAYQASLAAYAITRSWYVDHP